jgi:aryl-alcohol dehydrogenase-like predicted oxidoreductase
MYVCMYDFIDMLISMCVTYVTYIYISVEFNFTMIFLLQEWSLFSRDIEEKIVPTCRELGNYVYM